MAMTTCKECGKEISSSAHVCPHCGKKRAHWSLMKIVGLSFLAIVVLGIVLSAIYGTNSGNSARSSTVPQLPTIGDRTALAKDTSGCFTRKKLEAGWHAAAIHDKYGLMALVAENACITSNAGTAVLVLDVDNLESVPVAKVRILSGKNTGAAIWIGADDLKKS